MNKLIDMHTHTIYSDGDKTPDELIALAKKNDVGTISITDHNNVNVYNHITKNNNIDIIPGIELTAKDKGKMHILGYGIDPYDTDLNNITRQLKENDVEFILRVVDTLKTKGIRFADKDISFLINKEGTANRGSLARLLVDYGYADTISDAFNLYIDKFGKELEQDRKALTYEECFEAITGAGGIPILAHPYTLNRSQVELEKLVLELIKKGLKGIEVYHSKHNLQYIRMLENIVNKYNLLFSVGSDYHGESIKPDIEIGYGKEKNLCLTNCSVLNYLKNRK